MIDDIGVLLLLAVPIVVFLYVLDLLLKRLEQRKIRRKYRSNIDAEYGEGLIYSLNDVMRRANEQMREEERNA